MLTTIDTRNTILLSGGNIKDFLIYLHRKAFFLVKNFQRDHIYAHIFQS
jgi:hypothetical protein